MTSKNQAQRLQNLEAEDAALEQRIQVLEQQIDELREQGRTAYQKKNMRSAKEKKRCIDVLDKQLQQVSAMKINIFECLQKEQMLQFVQGYAKAIKPVSSQGLSIEAAQANIDGTVDFMEDVAELTDTIAEASLSDRHNIDGDDLEAMFGRCEIDDMASEKDPRPDEVLEEISTFPKVPESAVSKNQNKPPPPTQAEAELSNHLSSILNV